MSNFAYLKKPSGSVAVIVAAALVVLLTVAAFAVDLSNVFVSRNELQNSADAGALAGASRLANPDGTLAWEASVSVAASTAERNQSATGVTPFVQAASGYWNLDSGALSPPGGTVSARDFPGVEVSSIRSQENGNSVPSFFAKMIGVEFFDVEARSVAIISGPGYLERKNLFAFAVSKCIYDNYWDYARTPPGPRLNSEGEPETFTLRRDMKDLGSCGKNTIAWTVLSQGTANLNQPEVSNVVRNYGNSTEENAKILSINDLIGIWTAAVEAVYNSVLPCYRTTCKNIVVPVVSDVPGAGGKYVKKIEAFACLEIIDAAGSGKGYVKVKMNTSCPPPPSSGGIGPIFGTVTPPALVQ